MAADCIVVSVIPGRRQLRSANSGQLYIPRTRTVTFGPRSFKVCGLTIWMNFPLGWKIHLWVLTHFENCLRHSCLINDCYMSAFAVPVLTCARNAHNNNNIFRTFNQGSICRGGGNWTPSGFCESLLVSVKNVWGVQIRLIIYVGIYYSGYISRAFYFGNLANIAY